MSDPFIGEIRAFGFTFAPSGWAFCDGAVISIASNSALFAILGTTYGGNGTTTFGLPDLRGRAAMHWGNGAGLSPRVLGEQDGSPTVTLTIPQMPAHVHTITGALANSAAESVATPGPTAWIGSGAPDKVYDNTVPPPMTPFAPSAISQQGNSSPHQNMQPYQVLNYCIALQGVFPTHS